MRQGEEERELWIFNLEHICNLPQHVPWLSPPENGNNKIKAKWGEAGAPPRLLLPGASGAPATAALCWGPSHHCSFCEGNLLLRKVARQPCYHVMQAGPKAPQISKPWLTDELVLSVFSVGLSLWWAGTAWWLPVILSWALLPTERAPLGGLKAKCLMSWG